MVQGEVNNNDLRRVVSLKPVGRTLPTLKSIRLEEFWHLQNKFLIVVGYTKIRILLDLIHMFLH